MSITACSSFMISYVMALMAMAFYTLMERKFLGYFQSRKGPNKPSLMGLAVPFADAIKLFTKEQPKPLLANKIPFSLAPVTSLAIALMLWSLYPHSFQSLIMSFGILFFLCVSSTNVYTTFMAGWCSNSKYALLGALRGVAQTISYEVSMSLILITSLTMYMSLDLIKIKDLCYMSWPILMFPMLFLMWFITNLAETNRTPFDFAEGESELVSGFNVEYGSSLFALIFMAEYTSILAMSMITSSVFMGFPMNNMLSSLLLALMTLLLSSLFIWIRATLPRMRYDNLMYLTWKSFLPLTLGILTLLYPITLM